MPEKADDGGQASAEFRFQEGHASFSLPATARTQEEEQNSYSLPAILRAREEGIPNVSFCYDGEPDLNCNAATVLEEPHKSQEKPQSNRCWNPRTQIYVSHFLSSWGDRMWMFAGGLFLLKLTPGLLRLVAIYDGALSLTVILFGAPVGRWIDRSQRLRAAQISLAVQNFMVCVCASLLVVLLLHKEDIEDAWNGWAFVLVLIGVVLSSCIAQAGSFGSRIVIEKDWVVVICGVDRGKLSVMNSVLRTVDLSTALLAPIIVGAAMQLWGLIFGGALIAAWNITSLVVEYTILHALYQSTPALQIEKQRKENPSNEKSISGLNLVKKKLFGSLKAWRLYMAHSVRSAGLALALLYMTVLSFDNFSRTYVYDAGVSEMVLGVLTGCMSFLGILGSLTFPRLKAKIGLAKTGIFGYVFQSSCLVLCVVSIFIPGSRFQPSALWSPVSVLNATTTAFAEPSNSTEMLPTTFENNTQLIYLTEVPDVFHNSTSLSVGLTGSNDPEVGKSFTSVILYITGIMGSRFGLWIADLTVTQIFQEHLEESHRGAINGVQLSLERSFTLLRAVIVILLPTVPTFGYLIMLSYCFTIGACVLFITYARRHPGSPKA